MVYYETVTTRPGTFIGNNEAVPVSVALYDQRLIGRTRLGFSQFGEEGLIEAILEHVTGFVPKVCFEVGCSDGVFMSNTLALRKAGWMAYLADSDPELVKIAKLNRECSDILRCTTVKDIDDWLGNQRIGVGSIDVDGGDLDLLKRLYFCRPIVLVIEYRPTDPDVTVFSEELRKKGYVIVAKTWSNLIAVRSSQWKLQPPTDKGTTIMEEPKPSLEVVQLKTVGVMGIGRYTQTASRDIIRTALDPLGIRVMTHDGVYWHEGQERGFEFAVSEGLDAVLCLDSDTCIAQYDVERLFHSLVHYNLDAVCGCQPRRHSHEILVSTDEGTIAIHSDGRPSKVRTAHFGGTLIRVDAYKDLPKPWFLPRPNADGLWKEGKRDADIYFWDLMAAANKEVAIDLKVRLGHVEETVWYPDEEWQAIPITCPQYRSIVSKEMEKRGGGGTPADRLNLDGQRGPVVDNRSRADVSAEVRTDG